MNVNQITPIKNINQNNEYNNNNNFDIDNELYELTRCLSEIKKERIKSSKDENFLNKRIRLLSSEEMKANRIVEEINRYDLIASVVKGAEHVVFVIALPSTGGYILSRVTKEMSDNPFFLNTLTTAFLQFPFVFEGKVINRQAVNIWQLIESKVFETKKYRLEGLRETLSIGLERGNLELAKKIKNSFTELLKS